MSSQPIDKKLLKSLEPLGSLTPDKLDELAQKSRIEKMPADRILFRQGDRNKRLYYVLAGQVELSINGQKRKQIIKGKTDKARYPIAEESPRPSTARTKTEVTVLNVDQDLLEILVGDITQDAIEVTDLSGEHDAGWMLRFLQSPAFLHLPTENIQKLLVSLEEVSFQKGDVIVRQGDESDYYYIVQEGRCQVSRKPAPNTQDIKLAQLGVGDGFGEEALITSGKRNATISMLEDGSLMRLGKDDFLELLIRPLIHFYDEQEVIKHLAQGSLVIDVRNHDAFNENHIEGSINIPLSMLRAKIPGLNPERDYILVCDDGIQSEAAAFLLIQHGLNCHVLKNGLGAANIKTASPAAVAETTATKVETQKTRQADENKHIALAKAKRLKAERLRAKQQADQLADQARAAEQAKTSAESQLKRLKDKVQAQKDSALQSAQQQIQREMERAKKAEEELKTLVAAQNKNAEHQSSLNASLQQAEKQAQEQARIAQEVHKQAELEAAKIRKQAEQEAKRLRAEMEAERRQHEKAIEKARQEEARQKQRAIEEARQKAREAVKHTAAEAKAEADSIRQQAVQEASALRAEIEHTRGELEKSISDAQQKGELQRQMLLEEAQREAERVALNTTRQAEIEAEKIRLKALEEAERLRAEMESAKHLVEQEAQRVRMQQQQELQSQQKAVLAERSRQQKLAEQKRAEQIRKKQAQQVKTRQQQAAVAKADKAKQEKARQHAEAIKAKLEATAKEKFEQQQAHIPSGGLSVGNFTVKESKDRILLDSEEDSFIFKLPSITRIDKEKLLKEAGEARHLKKEELPSFEEDLDEPVFPKTEPQFTGTATFDANLDDGIGYHKEKNKNYFAIAAALVLAIGLGGFAYLKMTSIDVPGQTALQQKSNKTAASLLKQHKASKSQIAAAEKKVKKDAVGEFEALLNKWKRSIQDNEQ
ncbi:MAG: cyclic nucleotide-binding domain-containing protein [Gammaproteobacteria bacterium]